MIKREQRELNELAMATIGIPKLAYRKCVSRITLTAGLACLVIGSFASFLALEHKTDGSFIVAIGWFIMAAGSFMAIAIVLLYTFIVNHQNYLRQRVYDQRWHGGSYEEYYDYIRVCQIWAVSGLLTVLLLCGIYWMIFRAVT